MSFFPFRGPPWTPKPRKTRGFLIAPRWNSGTPRGPKHRKTRCFLTPRAKNTVNYVGFCDPEVTPPPWGRRQGRLATITFGYQPKASGKGTGQRPLGPAPGFKGYRPCRQPLSIGRSFFFETGRVRNGTFEALKEKKRAPVRRQKTWRNLAWTNAKRQPRQWIRNSKTPPKSELRRGKKWSFAGGRSGTFGAPKGEEESPST